MGYTFRTIADLKNRARKIAREERVTHHIALDEAARRGGYENYAHAVRHLPAEIEPPRHHAELRQWWRVRKTKEYGTATVTVPLRMKLIDLVKPHQLVGSLGGCKIDGDTRLISDGFMRDAEGSQTDLAELARTLQFMDTTGLKPSRARKCYPKGAWENRPPIADHDSCWFDPEARVHILVTQPYPGRASSNQDKQSAWEARHGWTTLHTKWGSMYGHGTEFFLLCPDAYAPSLRDKIALLQQSPGAIDKAAVSAGHVQERAAA